MVVIIFEQLKTAGIALPSQFCVKALVVIV
jgi:hypothetical protein